MPKLPARMSFSVLIKGSDAGWVAHCLELDIVTEAPGFDQVKSDMDELISTQVDYAFANNNVENLFHSAPPEAWKEFYMCTEPIIDSLPIERSFGDITHQPGFIPPEVESKTCRLA